MIESGGVRSSRDASAGEVLRLIGTGEATTRFELVRATSLGRGTLGELAIATGEAMA